ncbi:MAG: hypothetical protein RIB97_10230 [Nitratireductor sp.]
MGDDRGGETPGDVEIAESEAETTDEASESDEWTVEEADAWEVEKEGWNAPAETSDEPGEWDEWTVEEADAWEAEKEGWNAPAETSDEPGESDEWTVGEDGPAAEADVWEVEKDAWNAQAEPSEEADDGDAGERGDADGVREAADESGEPGEADGAPPETSDGAEAGGLADEAREPHAETAEAVDGENAEADARGEDGGAREAADENGEPPEAGGGPRETGGEKADEARDGASERADPWEAEGGERRPQAETAGAQATAEAGDSGGEAVEETEAVPEDLPEAAEDPGLETRGPELPDAGAFARDGEDQAEAGETAGAAEAPDQTDEAPSASLDERLAENERLRQEAERRETAALLDRRQEQEKDDEAALRYEAAKEDPFLRERLEAEKPIQGLRDSPEFLARIQDNDVLLQDQERVSKDLEKVQIPRDDFEAMRLGERPLGMSQEEFDAFNVELADALRREELSDAEVRLVGSSTRFYSDNPNKEHGHHFDKEFIENGRVPSDYDLNIAGDSFRQKMIEKGFELKGSGVFTNTDIKRAFPSLAETLNSWEQKLNRGVHMAGYGVLDPAPRKGAFRLNGRPTGESPDE